MKVLLSVRGVLDYLFWFSRLFLLGLLVLVAIYVLGPILIPFILGRIVLEILKA